MLKRLRRVACKALYFCLAHEQVPEIWPISPRSTGLPERYGPGTTAPLTIWFWKYGMATIR